MKRQKHAQNIHTNTNAPSVYMNLLPSLYRQTHTHRDTHANTHKHTHKHTHRDTGANAYARSPSLSPGCPGRRGKPWPGSAAGCGSPWCWASCRAPSASSPASGRKPPWDRCADAAGHAPAWCTRSPVRRQRQVTTPAGHMIRKRGLGSACDLIVWRLAVWDKLLALH